VGIAISLADGVEASVAKRHYILGSDDGSDFEAMCSLEKEPAPKKHSGLRMQLEQYLYVSVTS